MKNLSLSSQTEGEARYSHSGSQLPPSHAVPNNEVPRSAYLHVPFCRRRCYYCDFPISVVGDRKQGDNSVAIQRYVEVLCQEICITPPSSQPLETVFFGGGTPSLLSVNQLRLILETLDRHFGIAAGAEISLEIDPGTFSLEQVQGYQALGVNRLSLGVQAFQDELLKVCGRSHTVADIYEAVDLLRQADIDNISLDLISGLPHQTLDHWQASLEAAIALDPAHLSCYDLIVEPVTAFGRHYEAGVQPLPSDDTAAEMYRLAQRILTSSGYEHYEISNYARPGYQCRHNRVYWENRPFYGFGMGAASYLDGVRLTRSRTRQEYYQWVEAIAQTSQVTPPLPGGEDRPDRGQSQEVLLETLMLGLRLAEGVNLSSLLAQFGYESIAQIWTCLQPYSQQRWVEIVGATPTEGDESPPVSGQLRLSDPEGFLFSNTVLTALFSKLGKS